MATNTTASLGLTFTSLVDGSSIIQRSLPTEFFLALNSKEAIVNKYRSSTTPPIEFYSKTPGGHKVLGVPLLLCENGVGVDGGEAKVSLLPDGFYSAPPGMIRIIATWEGYGNDTMSFPIENHEMTLQELATFAANIFREFYEKASVAFLPGTHDNKDIFRLGPNCVANFDNISLRRVWYGTSMWALELSFTA